MRGRVFDGANQDAVGKAELTLLSGQSTLRALSAEDGSYMLGPIEPSAGYRLSAKADGMDAFEFTGAALPALDVSVRTRTLIGDVALFEEEMKTPAFNIKIASGDARLPMTVASVDFVPAVVGTDPSTVAVADVAPAGTVIGAYAQPHAATLPNHARSASRAFHTTARDGVALIPADALSWGATYTVKVDAGPDFTSTSFMLTPVNEADVEVVLETTGNPFSNQLPQDTQQYFTGRIYNGITLERLTNYSMRLEYFDRALEATVDGDGRYIVGPLLTNADYTIVVEADGFRSFLSHNQKLAITGRSAVSSLYYDAFVYPQGVQAPAAQVRISLEGETKLPSGTVRFAPRGVSSLFNDDAETPAGVNRQVWTNDEDLQQRAIVRDFSEGRVDLATGELVLGVEYAVSVYGVENYAILTNGSFRAGVDVNPSFTMQPVTEAPLAVTGMSTDGAALSANYSVEIRFNHPVVMYPRMDAMVAQRALNDAFAIVSPDKNDNDTFNVLVDPTTLTAPIAPNYRGVSWEIAGDRLTLKWDRERGLTSPGDTGDPIESVVYSDLSALWLYTGTLPTSPATTLADLIGSDSIEAQVIAR